MIDLSIVIVSWNVESLLRACLDSVYKELAAEATQSPVSAEVFVVDNASSDGTVGMVRQHFPQVRLIENRLNLGFTKANNQALSICSGNYILLLNPDCEMRPHSLRGMLSYMQEHDEVGAVGPQLLFPDGTIQSSRRRFPRLATGFVESTILQRYASDSELLRDYYCLDRSADIAQEVDWLVGACLLIQRYALEQVGLLDERFFMYSEELDWCYRAKKAGWKILYLPQAKVVHHEGKSSEQNAANRNMHFHDSKAHFFSKHHGARAGFLLRLFIFLTFLYQIAEESAKLLFIQRNRTMRRDRLAMLSKVTRHQFRRLLRST